MQNCRSPQYYLSEIDLLERRIGDFLAKQESALSRGCSPFIRSWYLSRADRLVTRLEKSRKLLYDAQASQGVAIPTQRVIP